MKNRDIFLKDPLSWTLANDGVSSNNDTDAPTLRYELETFVCDGEYRNGLLKMLQGYLSRLGQEQAGAWVSGFYGSGKSHLVKVLRYLWTDYRFPEGDAARTLCTLPPEITELLLELNTRGKQGAGLHAAGGTLKAGSGDVRARVLGILFRSVGLPEKVSVARLVLDLREDGKEEAIFQAITGAGKEPLTEASRMYTSRSFQEAYLAQYPHHGDTKGVGAALRAQYPANDSSISIDDMLSLIRRALSRDGKLPCTVLVLDEVQQYINEDLALAIDIQEIVEAVQKRLDGRVLLVATGQSALTDTPALQKIMGRFTIKVHLRDNDVEKVVRTVVLRKDPTRVGEIKTLLHKHAGEVTRQLKDTRVATRDEDRDAYDKDYPLLPVRRRFWEKVLHSTDPSGTAAQMRTQLRVTHEACRSVADKPLGYVIPGDFLYEQLAADLVISGEMQKRFQEIIEEQRGKPDGELRARLCSLVFLINKLPREGGADLGIRAREEHLGDLLTDHLDPAQSPLRGQIPALLTALTESGVLMSIDGEYRLQTTEGAAWDSEYRRRFSSLKNNDAQIAAERNRLLTEAIKSEVSGLNVQQGAARVKRKVILHHETSQPPKGEGLVVWVRDGFTEPETAILQHIQGLSLEDPTVHVLVPRAKIDELKLAIAGALAAAETLNFKGTPNSGEGIEARRSMESRRKAEEKKVQTHIAEVLGGARVLLSGGQETNVITLKEAAQAACDSVLSRLHPRFAVADSANWHVVWTRAKAGNAAALSQIGYNGDPDKHPVSEELLRFIGSGKSGGDLYSHFTGGLYGWPKEALDAVLATLMVSGHLNARLNGQPARLDDLDQRKVAQADYRVQHPVLTATQKLKIRKLFQSGNFPYSPGDEANAAPRFVDSLRNLAAAAGGPPPAPEPPKPAWLEELPGLHGNDLLFKLHALADEITPQIQHWQQTAISLSKRHQEHSICIRLVSHAKDGGLSAAAPEAARLDALRENRLLLDEPNPHTPIRQTLGSLLRTELNAIHQRHLDTLARERDQLQRQSAWQALPEDQQTALLARHGVNVPGLLAIDSDTDLLSTLDFRTLLARRTEIDALPTRCQQALAEAIRAAEPKAHRVHLPSATLKTPEEIDAWLTDARQRLLEGLKEGPVIL